MAVKGAVMILGTALSLAVILNGAEAQSPRQKRQALVALEQEWLHARDAAALERILAPDFVHPVSSGYFLTKPKQIEWLKKNPPPRNRKLRFGSMEVRLYGNVGIVNGVVIASDADGRELYRTVFTDVFVYRSGRWQMINAQENKVE